MKSVLAILFTVISFEASASECGLVKWYKADEGFGFIKPLNKRNGEDLYVSWEAIRSREDGTSNPLQENEKVIYDRINGPDGVRADNVKVVLNFPAGACK